MIYSFKLTHRCQSCLSFPKYSICDLWIRLQWIHLPTYLLIWQATFHLIDVEVLVITLSRVFSLMTCLYRHRRKGNRPWNGKSDLPSRIPIFKLTSKKKCLFRFSTMKPIHTKWLDDRHVRKTGRFSALSMTPQLHKHIVEVKKP